MFGTGRSASCHLCPNLKNSPLKRSLMKILEDIYTYWIWWVRFTLRPSDRTRSHRPRSVGLWDRLNMWGRKSSGLKSVRVAGIFYVYVSSPKAFLLDFILFTSLCRIRGSVAIGLVYQFYSLFCEFDNFRFHWISNNVLCPWDSRGCWCHKNINIKLSSEMICAVVHLATRSDFNSFGAWFVHLATARLPRL